MNTKGKGNPSGNGKLSAGKDHAGSGPPPREEESRNKYELISVEDAHSESEDKENEELPEQ